jgi:hypothetical protein
MTLPATKYPVQLLRDARGIYGIGVVGALEAGLRQPPRIILRPDRLLEATSSPAALQMITGGFQNGMFSHMAEESLRQQIHCEMLRRRGLKMSAKGLRWWSKDSEQQSRNRQVYHGLRLASLAVINRLIAEALEAAAEPNALVLARRFRFHQRYEIYCAVAASHRALQLTDAFPVLAVSIFAPEPIFDDFGGASANLVSEAKRLVEGGAPLRSIAELMGVPMAFRRVKPGAAHLALAVVDAFEEPRLIDAHMPESLPQMKLWLNCIDLARQVGPDFVQWTSRHAIEIGGSRDEVVSVLKDIADWVLAWHRASVLPPIRLDGWEWPFEQGEEFVTRGFNAGMSLATVTKLSADWHEAVAANMTGRDFEFPEPWCPGGTSGGFEIIPITSAAGLYREGKLMHHCAGTYVGQVRSGHCYIFSVQKDGAPLATLQLVRIEADVEIGQLRGAFNARPSKQVLRAVDSWLRAQTGFTFPEDRSENDIPFTDAAPQLQLPFLPPLQP